MKASSSPRTVEQGHRNAGGGSPAAAVGVPPGAVVIDGSQLEGGGQILRNGVALAAISRRPVYIDRIRAGRRNPGLSPQHLTGLQLVAAISRGWLQGGAERSSCISFVPGEAAAAAGSSFTADTRTAGSCTLMVQQALPCLLFAPAAAANRDGAELAQSQAGKAAEMAAGATDDSDRYGSAASAVVLKGGTDAAFAPPIGYLQHVLLPTLQRLLHLPAAAGRWGEHAGAAAAAAGAAPLSLELKRRGFYPKGGGEALLQVPALLPGCSLPSWDLTSRGRLVRIDGIAFTAGTKMRRDVGQRMAAACGSALKKVLQDPAVLLGGPAAAAAAAGRSRPDLPSSAAEHQQAGGPQQQQQQQAGSLLQELSSAVLDIQVVHEPPERAVGEGGGVILVATTSTGCRLGSSSLTARGVTAEAVGAAAAEELIEALVSGAAVDQWMQDQLIVFMALASGTSSMLCSDLTLHTRTAIAVVQQMLPGAGFTVAARPAAAAADMAAADERGASCPADGQQQQQQLCLVRCKGVGLVGR